MREPRCNDKVWLKGHPLYARETGVKPLTVKAYALGLAIVKPFKAREELTIEPSELDYRDIECLSGAEKRDMIQRWVKPEMLTTNLQWIKEMGVLGRLLKAYPDLVFWRQHFAPTFKVASLTWWFGGGRLDMRECYNLHSLDIGVDTRITSSHDTPMSPVKLGQDLPVKREFDITAI